MINLCENIADLYFNSDFLPALADKRLLRRFTALRLAADKLPLKPSGLMGGAPAYHESAAAADKRRRNLNHGFHLPFLLCYCMKLPTDCQELLLSGVIYCENCVVYKLKIK